MACVEDGGGDKQLMREEPDDLQRVNEEMPESTPPSKKRREEKEEDQEVMVGEEAKIFVRNFAEIKEDSEGEEDEVEVIVLDGDEVPSVQVPEKKDGALYCNEDDQVPEDLFMEARIGMEYKMMNPKLVSAQDKLSTWLKRNQSQIRRKPPVPKPAPVSPSPREVILCANTSPQVVSQSPQLIQRGLVRTPVRTGHSLTAAQRPTASQHFFNGSGNLRPVGVRGGVSPQQGNVYMPVRIRGATQQVMVNNQMGSPQQQGRFNSPRPRLLLQQPAAGFRLPTTPGQPLLFQNVTFSNVPLQRSPFPRSPVSVPTPKGSLSQVTITRVPVNTQPVNIRQLVQVPPATGTPVITAVASQSPTATKAVTAPTTRRPTQVPKPKPGTTVARPKVTAGTLKPIPGTVPASSTEPETKIFPSLVVQVKPWLIKKPARAEQNKARSQLDAQVRTELAKTPDQFTEWLLQRGLLPINQRCSTHPQNPYQLAKFTTPDKAPFSGGYVWMVPCCPSQQVSVFARSIFENSVYPPGILLKLMYHWICQSPSNMVVQWVNVPFGFLKEFFAYLRAVCTAWLHEMGNPLGGAQKFVEVGVITIGSTAETTQGCKQVSVEILGVFDPETKSIRMKVINGMLPNLFKVKGSSTEQGARAFQILWSLCHWVDKRSIVLIDSIVDPALLHDVGFRQVIQCPEGASGSRTNCNVLNYLRTVLPQMFHNTLAVLSKALIQQFLDELIWRETYAPTSLAAYLNFLDQIALLTKWDFPGGERLIQRLQKITQNPFLDWSASKRIRRSPLNTIPIGLRNQDGVRECVAFITKDEVIKRLPPPPPVFKGVQAQVVGQPPQQKRKRKKDKHEVVILEKPEDIKGYYLQHLNMTPKRYCLQSYYYGMVPGGNKDNALVTTFGQFPANLKCPLCIRTFQSNTEIVRHIFSHVSPLGISGGESTLCKVCMKGVPQTIGLNLHVKVEHKMEGSGRACRICEVELKSEEDLVVHMWHLHREREAPYGCGLCGFKSSFRCQVIQHHDESHKGEGNVMCPYCLQIMSAGSGPQLKYVIGHLQIHANSYRRCKKCPYCTLTFVGDSGLELHLLQHFSQAQADNWKEYEITPGEKGILMGMPPQSKNPLKVNITPGMNRPPPVKKPRTGKSGEEKRKVPEVKTLNVPPAVILNKNEKFGGEVFKVKVPMYIQGKCVECGEDCRTDNHFVGKLFCTRCRFQTSCRKSMDMHHEKQHYPGAPKGGKPAFKTNAVKMLDKPLACKCGYSSENPSQLAKHLVDCDQFTAYPIPELEPLVATPEKSVDGGMDFDLRTPDKESPSPLKFPEAVVASSPSPFQTPGSPAAASEEKEGAQANSPQFSVDSD